MPRVRRPAAPRGAVLLEALVALTLVAIAGLGMVTLLGQTVEVNRQLHRTERETRRAGEALEGLLVLDRATLAARVGRSRVGCCLLTVEAVTPDLYRVVLSDTATGAAILATSTYLPELTRATAN
jgi:Tfp pilus assembly protein PilV